MVFSYVLVRRTFDEFAERAHYTFYETKEAALEGMIQQLHSREYDSDDEEAKSNCRSQVMETERFWRSTWERRGHFGVVSAGNGGRESIRRRRRHAQTFSRNE